MKPCEIRKNVRWTQRYGVSNVSMEELSRDLSAQTISSDSHRLQCMKIQHFKLYIDLNRSSDLVIIN